jgi:hypothetical protein
MESEYPTIASMTESMHSLMKPLLLDPRLLIIIVVQVMLSYQNTDGGWPSYENQRGPALLEMLNPADVFGIFPLFIVLIA